VGEKIHTQKYQCHLDNTSPSLPERHRTHQHYRRRCRCFSIRSCQDGNNNNSIAHRVSCLAGPQARSGTTTPKAQTYSSQQTSCCYQEEDGYCKAQAIQESQWYVCNSPWWLILAVIRQQTDAGYRMYYLQSKTIKMRRDKANMSAVS
jgi:hypothetical protein